MILWAIVPVKPLHWSKSRLSTLLSVEERAVLSLRLLSNTLEQLNQVPIISRVIVISQDQSVLDTAQDLGSMPVMEEDGCNSLNAALSQATRLAHASGVEAVLVLPIDLPLINAHDIVDLVACMTQPPQMIIVPDRRDEGTNVLLINPTGMIDYQYGINSFRCHVQQAEEKQMQIRIFRSTTFGIDIDLPEDIELLKQLEMYPPVLFDLVNR